MRLANIVTTIAQSQQSSSDPLINQGGEDTIYFGIGLLAIAIILAVGAMNRRMEYAIVFSILLSLVLILIAVMS